MPTRTKHERATLGCRKNQTLALIARCRMVHTGMSAHADIFSGATPTMTVFDTQTNAFEAADHAVRTKAVIGTEARENAREALWMFLHSLMSYVQLTANADPANAVTIIKSAGFEIGKTSSRTNPAVKTILQDGTGEAVIVASPTALGVAGRQVTYNFETSIDGGHTWVAHPGTSKGTITILGLPMLAHILARVSVSVRGKSSVPTDPIGFVLR